MPHASAHVRSPASCVASPAPVATPRDARPPHEDDASAAICEPCSEPSGAPEHRQASESAKGGGDERAFREGTFRDAFGRGPVERDRKSTRLNSSHSSISYAVFCLKKKK